MFSSANRDEFVFEKTKMVYVSTDRTKEEIQNPSQFSYNINLPRDNIFKRVQLIDFKGRFKKSNEISQSDVNRYFTGRFQYSVNNVVTTSIFAFDIITFPLFTYQNLTKPVWNVFTFAHEMEEKLNLIGSWTNSKPDGNWTVSVDAECKNLVVGFLVANHVIGHSFFFEMDTGQIGDGPSPLFGLPFSKGLPVVTNLLKSGPHYTNELVLESIPIFACHYQEIRIHCDLVDNNGDDLLAVIYNTDNESMITYRPLDTMANGVGLLNNKASQAKITITDENDIVIPENPKYPVKITLKFS